MKANVYDNGQAASAPGKTRTPSRRGSGAWLIVGLILLSAIPLIFGAVRLNELASGAEITPANARFFASRCRWCCTSWARVCMPCWVRSNS